MTEEKAYVRANLHVTGIRWKDGATDGDGNTELLPDPVDDSEAEEFAILKRDDDACVDSFPTRAEAEEYLDLIAPVSETERLETDALAKRKAFQTRHGEVQSLAKIAAEAASKAVFDAHDQELESLRKAAYAAETTFRDHVSATAAHPMEGRLVEREVTRGRYSWNSKTHTERGRLEVRRKETEFSDSTWRHRYNVPELGSLFIRRLRKDGSVGNEVIKVYRVNDDGSLSCSGLGKSTGWKVLADDEATA
jgi:hypothetical protein